jgi:hypothetical protein
VSLCIVTGVDKSAPAMEFAPESVPPPGAPCALPPGLLEQPPKAAIAIESTSSAVTGAFFIATRCERPAPLRATRELSFAIFAWTILSVRVATRNRFARFTRQQTDIRTTLPRHLPR